MAPYWHKIIGSVSIEDSFVQRLTIVDLVNLDSPLWQWTSVNRKLYTMYTMYTIQCIDPTVQTRLLTRKFGGDQINLGELTFACFRRHWQLGAEKFSFLIKKFEGNPFRRGSKTLNACRHLKEGLLHRGIYNVKFNTLYRFYNVGLSM